MIRTLVLLPSPGDIEAGLRWLRIDALGGISGGGAGVPVADDGEVIAVAPGDAVVLHWTELPALAPAQAAAAARMLAADVSATPIETTHVASGPRDAAGWTVLGLVDAEVMAGWLALLGAAGIDAARVVPAQLLLPVPGDGGVSVHADGGLWLVRGERVGFAAEPGLAAMMIGEAAVHRLDDAAFAAGVAAMLGTPLLDLRQGRFARRQVAPIDRGRLRRLAVLALAIFGVLLATEVAGLLRFSFAADRAELALADAARAALPRGTVVTAPQVQVAARLAGLGGGDGFDRMAGAVLAAVRDRPGVAIDSLAYGPDTGLVAVLEAPAAADRDAVVAAVGAAGLTARMGGVREDGGRTRFDLNVRGR